MKKKQVISALLILASLGLAVLCFFILPESVIIQFSVNATGNTAVPRLVAILIPLALGIGGAVSGFFEKEDGDAKHKGLIVSLVGLALFVIMIAVNCR